MVDAAAMHKQVLVLRLISKYRTVGFFQADLDPLQRADRPYIADLDVKTYGFTDADFDSEFDIGSYKGAPQGASRMRLRDLISALQGPAARSAPVLLYAIPQKRFIQQRLEPLRSRPSYAPEFRRHILERLTAAETSSAIWAPSTSARSGFLGRRPVVVLDAQSEAGAGGMQKWSSAWRTRRSERAGQYARQHAQGPVRRVRGLARA
jgi:hypothetical protein